MEIGVVGKPNVGKSTLFNACTLGNAEVAAYPFTTIKPNRAVAAVRTRCVCRELGVEDNPRNSRCVGGERFVPIEVIDVAGLVPKAHEGRGLGNQFLDELRRASVLIHVVDAAGATDAEGVAVPAGTHDPVEDVRFLEEEIEAWFFDIFRRSWDKVSRKVQYEGKDFVKYFEEMYVGIGFQARGIIKAVGDAAVNPEKPHDWSKEDLARFTGALRRVSKPIIIAANKTDMEQAAENIKRLREAFPGSLVVPTSSMGEYVLRKLAEEGAVRYLPGDRGYEVLDASKISERQQKALEIIGRNVLGRFGTTGVQECINAAVFDLLGKVVVYPVEDENRYSDKDGRILPDALLLDRGSTPRDLAFRIHTEIGEAFIGAIDARTKRKISSDKPLSQGDVVKILTR